MLLGVSFLLVVRVSDYNSHLMKCLTFSTLRSLRLLSALQGRKYLTKQCISFWLRSVYKLLCKLDVGFFNLCHLIKTIYEDISVYFPMKQHSGPHPFGERRPTDSLLQICGSS